MQSSVTQKQASFLDKPVLSSINLNWEAVLFAAIILLAIVTRFYDLESRVMSHDENSHVYYSWQLYKGNGYQHTPLTHGPFQFHAIALSYFLFGDSDTAARIPAVLTGILTIVMMWPFRRYLGKAGALTAGVLLTISPYILYYARYVRNESYVGLFGIVVVWALLRYLDTGENKYIYWITIASVLHFTAKETAFIYTAQAMLFLGLVFVVQVIKKNWVNAGQKRLFLIALISAVTFAILAVGLQTLYDAAPIQTGTETITPAVPGEELVAAEVPSTHPYVPWLGAGAGLSMVVSVVLLFTGYTLPRLREERSLDLIMLFGVLVLPQLSAFPVFLAGGNPLDYSTEGLLRTGTVLVPFTLIAIGVAYWWKRTPLLISMGIFFSIFTFLYTTVFTNGEGFFTGLVGSLGYWLEQQGVERGSQPPYYYVALQVPVYEFLPALGSLFGIYLVVRDWLRGKGGTIAIETDPFQEISGPEQGEALPKESEAAPQDSASAENPYRSYAVPLLIFWIISSIAAYTIAGEKMPWLTYHIALPMILFAGWAIGRTIEETDWKAFREKRGWVIIALLLVLMPATFAAIGQLLGTNPPFRGQDLTQLRATSNFLIGLISAIVSSVVLVKLLRPWTGVQTRRLVILTFFGLLAIITTRSAFTATYINYDNPTEYLVYAHSATGVKEVLSQIEDISRRTTDGLGIGVAFDDITTYPFWWYLRNFPNQHYYGANPSRTLQEYPIILAGETNFAKLEPITRGQYHSFDYIRIWWPNQDYYNLTWERIRDAFTDAEMRAAIFDIWFNRDYTKYAEKTGKDFSLSNWSPSGRMRLYVRKDIANQLWNYGVSADIEEFVDPYEGKQIDLTADIFFGSPGIEPGQFNAPRGIAVAPDGTLYVADSRNHRIQHLDREGNVLHIWGTFADVLQGNAPGGTFNEPWDLAVGPDGSVYVADTWNHRIQKFTPEGEFIQQWGTFGQGETPFAFWGPRGITIDDFGNVYVTDTGNKRVAVFDELGGYIDGFGTVGFSAGEFDEPVGVAVDEVGRIFVVDTWNQRMQMFAPLSQGFTPLKMWDIEGWYGNSLENKPYAAIDPDGNLFITDPEGFRILEFDGEGEFLQYFGDFSSGPNGFGLASGVTGDVFEGIWVTDGANNRVMHFSVPPVVQE